MKTIIDRIVLLIDGVALALVSLALVDFLIHPLAPDNTFNSPIFRIDIIRRTLAYSILTVALSVVFFSNVAFFQSLFSKVSGEQSTAAIVLSTHAIAELFNPLRRGIQERVDQRLYRQKYNAEKVLAAFR